MKKQRKPAMAVGSRRSKNGICVRAHSFLENRIIANPLIVTI